MDEALRPTKKQKELLDFIGSFIAEHGYSPSYREIMNGLEYTSVATVALHVNNLIARGHLRKRDNSARSLEVVEAADGPAPLKTNAVKDAEEKWLVGKVEQKIKDAEELPVPLDEQMDSIAILLAALKVLGLDAAAVSFTERFNALRAKLQGTDKA